MVNLQYLQIVYEKLHQYPEVALEEYKTSEFIAGELRDMGFNVRTNVGGTGVVGTLEFALPGKTLAFRSDMDALPITEATGVKYASKNPGVMHACGHDSHMAILLTLCKYAAEHKKLLAGRLIAIFQPAEEIVVGAKAMLQDGIFTERKPDVFVAIHNWPSLPAGTLGLQAGPVTAFADRFDAVFTGKGGHGSAPERTNDPIAMAALGINNAFTAEQRSADPLFPRALSFGVVRGGTSFNVIPERVELEGTVRTVRLEDQKAMIELLHRAFTSAASLYGGNYELNYRHGVPAAVNDAEVVANLQSIFAKRNPDIPLVCQGLASLIGEDAAYFMQEVPGVLLLIGSGQKGGVNELHNPRFIVPLASMITGCRALVSVLKAY